MVACVLPEQSAIFVQYLPTPIALPGSPGIPQHEVDAALVMSWTDADVRSADGVPLPLLPQARSAREIDTRSRRVERICGRYVPASASVKLSQPATAPRVVV